MPSAFEKQVKPHVSKHFDFFFYVFFLLKPLCQWQKTYSSLVKCKKCNRVCFHSLQGSSKLEKAEILQMTVDHLKLLHAMGGKGGTAYMVGFSLSISSIL